MYVSLIIIGCVLVAEIKFCGLEFGSETWFNFLLRGQCKVRHLCISIPRLLRSDVIVLNFVGVV